LLRRQALSKLEEAQSNLDGLADRVRRLCETRAIRHSLRASLQSVEQQLQDFSNKPPPPEDAWRRQKEGARPATAPEAANLQDHGTKLLQLQLEAERAHRELEGKTRELADLERELEESQDRRLDSIS
jgi:hypothetical protein